jgi:hypothetical protein
MHSPQPVHISGSISALPGNNSSLRQAMGGGGGRHLWLWSVQDRQQCTPGYVQTDTDNPNDLIIPSKSIPIRCQLLSLLVVNSKTVRGDRGSFFPDMDSGFPPLILLQKPIPDLIFWTRVPCRAPGFPAGHDSAFRRNPHSGSFASRLNPVSNCIQRGNFWAQTSKVGMTGHHNSRLYAGISFQVP